MANPLVSFVIPVYNGQLFLAECIRGLLQQSFHDYEIVFVDDCSPDQSLSILRSYDNPNIRVFENPSNLGPLETRKRGVEYARGVYISFVDDDDVISPCFLSTLLKYSQGNTADIVISNVRWVWNQAQFSSRVQKIDESKIKKTATPSGALNEFLFSKASNSYTSLFAKLIKRSLLLESLSLCPRCRPKMSEDVMVLYSIYRCCKLMVTVPATFYYVFRHSSSLGHSAAKTKGFFWDAIIWHWIYLDTKKDFPFLTQKAATRGLQSLSYVCRKSLQNHKAIFSYSTELMALHYLSEYLAELSFLRRARWKLFFRFLFSLLHLLKLIDKG